jgi:Mlc titration factor MtfA (ptsG expression regulator)
MKTQDPFFDNVVLIMHEAAHAFYQWEQGRYNGNSPLSDEDRLTWMQGYVYAYNQMREKSNAPTA